jgi:flagellar motor protein MotB
MVVIAVGLVNAGGCLVLKSEYDKANTLNRNLTRQLREARADVDRLTAENAALLDSAGGDPRLEADYNQLLADYDVLRDKYDELAAGDTGPLPPIVDDALARFANEHPDVIEYQPRFGMVKLKADLTFAAGSVAIQPGAEQALSRLAQIVSSADAEQFNIYIAGHTDDLPISKPETKKRHPNNWYLSVHRAVAVEKLLLKAGVGPKRLAVMGFGEHQPVAPNAPNNRGNKLNRRVEIWLVPPGQFLTTQ